MTEPVAWRYRFHTDASLKGKPNVRPWMLSTERIDPHPDLEVEPLYTHPAASPAHQEPICTRSHPHENMDAGCERLTTIARQNSAAARSEHVCGMHGYNGMIDPPCPGCECNRLARASTPSGREDGNGKA